MAIVWRSTVPSSSRYAPIGTIETCSFLTPVKGVVATMFSTSTNSVRRIALVIGNADYGGQQTLAKPAKDASAIASRLRSKALNFKVISGDNSVACGLNLDLAGMTRLFGAFITAIQAAKQDGAVVHALIHYAGHGLQIADENYLVPIGAKLGDASSLSLLFPLRDHLLQAAEEVGSDGIVIAFFDACREQPFAPDYIRALANDIRSREAVQRVTAVSRGFAIPNLVDRRGSGATSNDRQSKLAPTYFGFATAPGEVAYDGDAEATSSPFTEAICKHIAVRGLEIEEFYNRVQQDVRARVRGLTLSAATREQIPWSESNLQQPFYFYPHSWWPVIEMTALGWLAGLLTCLALFNPDLAMQSADEKPILWLTGLFSAIAVGYGSWRWGSGRKLDVAYAIVGTMLAFALALGILQNQNVLQTIARVGRSNALDVSGLIRPSWLEHSLAVAAGSLVALGRYLQMPGNAARRRWGLPLLSGLLTFALLLVVQLLVSIHGQTDILVFAMLSLFSGLTLGLGIIMSCRPQQSIFKGFGPITGGMAAGMSMPVFFLLYALHPSWWTLYTIAPFYFATLGFQLGWCLRYYVGVHRTD